MKSPYETKNIPTESELKEMDDGGAGRRRGWVVLCLSLAAVSVVYRLLVGYHVEQTALLFIGLPTLLAILLSMTPSAGSVTGRIMKGITMMLLLSGILFIEGMICILLAAPIFYLVGFFIGMAIDCGRNPSIDSRRHRGKRMNCCVVGVMLLFSLEGVTEWLSFGRDELVVVTHSTELSRAEVMVRLKNVNDFNLNELPGFLKLGFPRPVETSASGLELGTEWRVHFEGGEGEPGDLVMRVTSIGEDHIECRCVSDGSHIAHWLEWQSVRWEFSERSDGGTEVKMRMKYRRELDPAWYFKPIERYAVRKAGEYFIQQQLTQ